MNDTTKSSLREFCKQYSVDHPESKRSHGGANEMYLAARKAGYECSRSAIHGIRYVEGLGTKYVSMQKAAQKRQKEAAAAASGPGAQVRKVVRKRRRTKYASAAAAMAAKLAARRVRRQMAAEQANGHANGQTNGKAEEPAEIIAPRATSTERAFLDAIAQVGLERAKGLITRFEKLSRS